MGYNEDLAKLKEKVDQLFTIGYQTDTKGMLQQTFIQILNEAEKNRQSCMNAADNFKKQAAIMEGQANAFCSFSSIITSVLSGYISVAQRVREEEARQASDLVEKETESKEEQTPKVPVVQECARPIKSRKNR